MKPSQKLALRLSEVRQKLNELLAIDAPSDDQRSQMAALTAEYQKLEPEFRAAVIADGQPPEDVETRGDGESAEYRALVERVELGAYLVEAVNGREVDGAEAELRAAVFGDSARQNLVPWEALLPRQAASEDRVDAATSITTDVARNQQTILGRVFADTAAAFVGVDMPSVAIGQASYPVFTDGVDAELKAKGAVKDAEAATITATTLDPTRLTARYVLRVEDAARLMGLEEALRADLRGALGEELDSQVINGDGTAPNFAGFFDDGPAIDEATDPSAKSDYAAVAALAANAIDGRYCRSAMGAKLLFGVAGLQYAHGQFPTSGDYSAADYLMAKTGGLMASTHVPAAASNIHKLLVYRADRGMGSAVCPIWQGLEIIRDQYTGAAKGEIALTAIALHSFAILRKAAYRIEKIKDA